jgi:hypothetical protein
MVNDTLTTAFIIFGLVDLTFVGTTTLAVCILVLRILKGRKVEKIVARLEKLATLGKARKGKKR